MSKRKTNFLISYFFFEISGVINVNILHNRHNLLVLQNFVIERNTLCNLEQNNL